MGRGRPDRGKQKEGGGRAVKGEQIKGLRGTENKEGVGRVMGKEKS